MASTSRKLHHKRGLSWFQIPPQIPNGSIRGDKTDPKDGCSHQPISYCSSNCEPLTRHFICCFKPEVPVERWDHVKSWRRQAQTNCSFSEPKMTQVSDSNEPRTIFESLIHWPWSRHCFNVYLINTGTYFTKWASCLKLATEIMSWMSQRKWRIPWISIELHFFICRG